MKRSKLIFIVSYFLCAAADFTGKVIQFDWGRDHVEQCSRGPVQDVLSKYYHNASYSQDILVVTHASCFSFDSFGNMFANYVEARLCADVLGATFVGSPLVVPSATALLDLPFYQALPMVVENHNAINSGKVPNQKAFEAACPCQSICHEWGYGLMHSHMPAVGKIFRDAVDYYWIHRRPRGNNERNDSVISNSLDFSLLQEHSGSKVMYKGSEHLITKHSQAGSGDLHSFVAADFPVIPDVAIHYRCGDNVVTHYGFLPFAAIRNAIKQQSVRTIYILAEHPGRKTDIRRRERCHAIFESLLQFLSKYFPSSIIVLLRGHDMFEDLARLTYAKISICSVSTFCLFPSVASNTSSYFPVTKLIAKEETNHDYGPHFHWLVDPKYRVLRGFDTNHMSNAEVVRVLSRE